MKIKKQELENSQEKYTITIDGKEWEDCRNKGLTKLTKNIQLPGFRKGKVPLDIVKGKISDEEIIKESASFATDMAYKFMLEKEKPEILIQPTLEIDDITNEKAELSFIVQLMPKIKLKKYSGFNIKKDEPKASAKDVDVEINKLLVSRAKLNDFEGKAEKGHIIIMNFEGFIDGKPFPGGKGEKSSLELGSGQFIKGFEEQLIGSKKGDKKELDLTFPKEYHVKELANKKALFKCEILDVKTKTTPVLDDTFVKNQKFPEINTVKEMKDAIKKNLQSNMDIQALRAYEKKLIDALVKENEFEVPNKFLELETNQLLKNFEEELKKRNRTIEQFKKDTGKSDQQIAKEFALNAENRIKITFLFETIARKEKIDLDKKEVDTELESIAKSQNKTVDQIKKEINVGQIAYNLRMQKIFNVIKK